MAKRIRVDLPNDSFFVEIAGDTPTPSEELKIMQVIAERKASGPPQQAAEIPESDSEQLPIDTFSGVKSASLRAALSTAETPEDEEAQLRAMGLTETDFLRDERGRLALTPSGGEKVGVQLNQPTLIDESGFSRYDFADLAGIAPEVVGGVAGAVKGAAMGAPLGPIGILLGGATGAGLGAAGGQAIEESAEALAGVQTQTAEEVAKDLGKEFAIGFLTDATLGTFGLGLRGARSLAGGTKPSPEDIITAKQSIDEGILPPVSAIGAPAVISRQQRIAEQVFGSSPRLKGNYENMTRMVNDFRSKYGSVDDTTAGQLLKEGAEKKKQAMLRDEVKKQTAILQTIRNLGEDLGAVAEKNMQLDQNVFDILVDARKAFDEEMTAAFRPVDDVLDSAFGSEKIIPIENIRVAAADIASLEEAGLAAGTMKELDGALRAIKTLGKSGNVSYTQLYNARKALNDTLAKVPYSNKTQRKHINDLMRKIDAKLSANNLTSILDDMGDAVPKEARSSLINASKSLDNARGLYNEGAKIFEDIESAGIIKNLSAKAANNQTMGVDDVALDKIIRANKPRVLQRALSAVEYGASKDAKKASSEQFRQMLANEWMNDALTSSGISKLNDIDPTKFKPGAFAKSIRDLGKTADVLFGDDVGKVRQLASQIEKVGLTNVKKADVDNLIAQVGENAPLVNKLDALRKAQSAKLAEDKSDAFRKLSSGSLNPTEAAELIAAKGTTASETARLMNFFEGNDEALRKIRGNFMERIMANFGDGITVDGKELNEFSKAIIASNQGDKLAAVFGEETAKELTRFAKILELNSRTAKGGDLVAANIAASPLANIDKLLRFSVFLRFFSIAPQYSRVAKEYDAITKGMDSEQKSATLGRLMGAALSKGIPQSTAQATQEAVREAENQVTALVDSSGLGQQISSLRSQVTTPNISPSPAPAAQAPQAPNNLRQQAAQNPGIAAALGIQGSTAGLLTP